MQVPDANQCDSGYLLLDPTTIRLISTIGRLGCYLNFHSRYALLQVFVTHEFPTAKNGLCLCFQFWYTVSHARVAAYASHSHSTRIMVQHAHSSNRPGRRKIISNNK